MAEPREDIETPSEEERVIESVEHQSQSAFEKSAIFELTEKFPPQNKEQKVYPLDGRHLEISARFLKKKKRLLQHSVKQAEEGTTHKRTRTSERSASSGSMCSFKVETDAVSSDFLCPHSLWDKLYDFQKDGVKFLLSKYELSTGGLLADEMGLGKSVQVVAFLVALAATYGRIEDPVLIISPTTLIAHWEDQFLKWSEDSSLVSLGKLEDGLGSRDPANVRVRIVSYESFRSKHSSELGKKKFAVVVLDEAQRVRNPDAKITMAVKKLNCYCRIALSGSPIQNRLAELWSIFDFVAPGRLGTLPTFEEELAVPIEQGTKPRATLQQIQLSHRCALVVRDLTAPLMLRRLKSDFQDQLKLAQKEEQVLFCQLSREQIEVYCKFLSTATVRNMLQSEGERGKTFYCLSVLRRICNHPDLLLSDELDVPDYGSVSRSGKLAVLVPLIQLWQRQGKRALIFSQSLGMLDVLELTLRGLGIVYCRMDGSTPIGERARIVALFDKSNEFSLGPDDAGPTVLLLSTRVGGVGLNLTGAERVVIFDPDWNPMTDAQARERSWRIGQTKHVKIYRLIAAETVEEVICKRQIYKHHLAQKILVDARQGRVGEWDNLHDLFRAPTGRASSGSSAVVSETTKRIFAVLDSGEQIKEEAEDRATTPPPQDEEESYRSLITKIWDQDEIEMPKICSALVDEGEAERAASRAVELVLGEANSERRDITVPTWTGRNASGGRPSTSSERSKSLVSSLKASSQSVGATATVVESQRLIVEKQIVKDLLSLFREKDDFSIPTEELLKSFDKKISAGQSEIFRSCLRELCLFSDGIWVLKRDHR